jgi:hypothetical protein
MEDPFTGEALLSNSRVLRANTWAEFDSHPWVDRNPIGLQSNMPFSRGPSDAIFDLLSYSGSTLGGVRVARVGPDQSRAKDGCLKKLKNSR